MDLRNNTRIPQVQRSHIASGPTELSATYHDKQPLTVLFVNSVLLVNSVLFMTN